MESKISKGDTFEKGGKIYAVMKAVGDKISLQDAVNPESCAVFETSLDKLIKGGYIHSPIAPKAETKTEPKAKAATVAKPKAEAKPKTAAKPKPEPKAAAKPTPKPKAEAKPKPEPKAPAPKATVKKVLTIGGVEIPEVKATLTGDITLGGKGGAVYKKGNKGWLVNVKGFAVFVNEYDSTIFQVTEKEVSITK